VTTLLKSVNEPSLNELPLFGLGLFKFFIRARVELKDEPKNQVRAHNESSQAGPRQFAS
jgi:hypothetical protein